MAGEEDLLKKWIEESKSYEAEREQRSITTSYQVRIIFGFSH